jgi:hypothetical protein
MHSTATEVDLPRRARALNQVAVEELHDRQAILRAITEKRVVKFEASAVLPSAPFGEPLHYWAEQHGDAPVHRHRLTEAYARDVERVLGALAPDAELDLRRLPLREGQKTLAHTETSLAAMLETMRCYADYQPDTSYATIKVSCAEQREMYRRLGAYGVTNARNLAPSWTPSSPFERWKRAYNFLWFGLSPGGMHYDPFDNMLIQLSGRKQVLIYHPDLCDAVDGSIFVTRFPLCSPHAPEVLEEHRLLQHLPYYKVELTPGTGVVLPARAYHAPLALTHDSISLNTFLFPYYAREPRQFQNSRVASLALQAFMGFASLAYETLGLKLISVGPYDWY